MDNSIKRIRVILIVLLGAFAFGPLRAVSADTIPADAEELSKTRKSTVEEFLRESFRLRLEYEYYNGLTNYNNRKDLQKLAKKSFENLMAIKEKQEIIKTQIENYTGSDWDEKFGRTGLWRKVAGDFFSTTMNSFQVQFYMAVSSGLTERNEILSTMLERLNVLEESSFSADLQLLRAQALSVLSRSEPTYKSAAISELEQLLAKRDTAEAVYCKAVLEKIKLSEDKQKHLFESLVERLKKSGLSDDPELILPLVFLQKRYGYREDFEKTILTHGLTQDFLGGLILEELEELLKTGELTSRRLSRTEVFDAELAVVTAGKRDARNHESLLLNLLETEKFQTPLITYVTAMALAQTRGEESVKLLIKSSRRQMADKSSFLILEPEQIAAKAAKLAYNNFTTDDSSNSKETLAAFENYFEIVAGQVDEQLKYLYSVVLINCGQPEKAKKQLEKITSRPAGTYFNRARLDLILRQLRQTEPEDSAGQTEIKNQLKILIDDCSISETDKKLATEARKIYCQLLMDTDSTGSARHVLEILRPYEKNDDAKIKVLLSKAFQQLAQPDESAKYMLEAMEDDSCLYQTEAKELLRQIVEKIDQLQTKPDFAFAVEDYKKLARFCYDCSEEKSCGLWLVEIEIVAADKQPEKLAAVENLLADVSENMHENADLLRCRARLLTERGDFSGAGPLWAEICRIRKAQNSLPDTRNQNWWRAKFYEIYCLSKLPQTKKVDVLHAIDILKHSYSQSPGFWLEKFNLLEKQLGL